jgi:hypothetical protein
VTNASSKQTKASTLAQILAEPCPACGAVRMHVQHVQPVAHVVTLRCLDCHALRFGVRFEPER